ncbi:hypothetical protein XAR_3718 [Xanthomonas citri pv. glycines str. 8ra]|nr:hypothetical protein XAR_3718 [Xanthomonas citri pv. glycines str. 8ra]
MGHRTLQQSVGPPARSALASAPHGGRRILVGAFSRKYRQPATCLRAGRRRFLCNCPNQPQSLQACAGLVTQQQPCCWCRAGRPGAATATGRPLG